MQQYIPLIARICLSAIFLKAGVNKILAPGATQQAMAAHGIPFSGILLIPTIAVLLIGGLSILSGYKTCWGAWLLIGFLIPTTLIFHSQFPAEETAFLKNLGLMGGLLMLVAFGAGHFSLDNRQSQKNSRTETI